MMFSEGSTGGSELGPDTLTSDPPRTIEFSVPESSTLLERRLPFRELSLIAQADRRGQDPAYSAHRWWARRPPGVIRGLLLAAMLRSDFDLDEYWRIFASEEHALKGIRVHDPFVGGGSSLIEAARLGAIVSGTDVDPLAVQIVRHELESLDTEVVTAAVKEFMEFVEAKAGPLFAGTSAGWTAVHYFYIYEVQCRGCGAVSPLYRDLIIARRSDKSGAVRRGASIIAFCPDCFALHELERPNRRELRCCRRRKLASGNFAAARFTCPACGQRAKHKDLVTGKADRRLLAVEETGEDQPRRIRAATERDRALLQSAAHYLSTHKDQLQLPKVKLETDRWNPRPVSFGITRPTELFTERQLVVFGHGFRWLRDCDYPPGVKRALVLGLSNALATNNRLCGYARDYGRLAPLFSIRAYSLPTLSVELNPFHSWAGRGTLRSNFRRVIKSTNDEVRRHTWSPKLGKVRPITTRFDYRADGSKVVCASADSLGNSDDDPIDLCLFDPPYFDYIAYSELSEFYRCWLDEPELGGSPLLPRGEDPSGSFGRALARCLRSSLERLRPRMPMVFTFHSASAAAWDAIGIALDEAHLVITAMWPLRTDSHMGHHSSEGNCEWDLVVVCRRETECETTPSTLSVKHWQDAVKPLSIGQSDARSMELAVAMSTSRFGISRPMNRAVESLH